MSSQQGIKVFYGAKMGTFKIFLNPDPNNKKECNLGVRNIPRMMSADNRHHELFGKGTGKKSSLFSSFLGKKMEDDTFENGIVNNTDDLFREIFDKLKTNINNDNNTLTFTYCYKSDGRLYLCNTKGKVDDEKCKHAWLCNKIQGICSAGIMMFSRNDKTIHIDNMSGTYKTSNENLKILKAAFEISFPGININLLTPMEDNKKNEQYCDVMTTDSVDYEFLCANQKSGGKSKKIKPKTKTKKHKNRTRKNKKTTQ